MRHLLVHTNTFARIETALKSFSDQLSPILIDDEGEMTRPWGESEAGSAIVFGNQDSFFSPSVQLFMQTLLGFEHLDWFQSSAAGLEHPMLQMIGQKADLYTACHAQSDAIAEWVIWAGLDYFHKGRARREAQAQRRWQRLPFRELSSTHWLIIGFGAIGQAAGQRLKALGAQVTGVRRSGGTSIAADEIITPNAVPARLGTADAVLLCLPHSPETESLADAAFFAAMQPGALFVNVGRGALVDEAALLAGLDAGRPGHAALDVFREEPQPDTGPFWNRDDVTMTAHISAMTEQSKIRTDAIFLENLPLFLAGEPMINLVPASAFA